LARHRWPVGPSRAIRRTDSYEAIFGVDVSGTPTLLDALGANGGGVNALLRHSSAALLNAANPYVDYAYTVAEIIAQTKAAIESGNATLIESTKDQFAVQNELGADLSTPETGSIHETAWYDADLPGSGPVIPVGGEAIFQYVVTNEGDVAIDNVSVTDSRLATVTYVSGDLDNDNKLDTNETWVYTASETVQGGTDVVNTGTVTGTGGSIPVSDEDDAHYSTPGLAQSLGDRVWLDANANGIQDAGEQGLAGVTVLLKDTVGAVLQTTTTDFNGNYLFDVAVGSYQVTFETPSDYVVSPSDKGSDDNLDSDIINPATKTTGTIAIAAGEQNLSVDAGVYQTASLGDKVWLDCNGNGVQDGGEVGVAGATVKLIGGGADGKIAGTGDNTITTTTTSAASGHVGEYAFTGLTPGMEYQVQFVPLTGYSFTTKDAAAATDATDSDADLVTGKTQVVKLASGENNPTLDAGLTPDCRPVTFDFSGSSATDGTDGNSRTYTDALTGVSVTARAFSQSKLADNTPTNTWQTAWLGAYSGGLGVTDSSEGTGSGNTHTVDNVGRNNYVVLQFSQSVKLDQAYLGYVVNDSDMKVWIGNSASTITTMDNSVLSSMSFSEVNTTTLSSARWADLNAGGVTGNVVIIAADTTDTSPEDYFKVEKVAVCAPDYCLPVAKASIGDFVWEDKNYNGVQDGGESGIANVTVKLLNSANTVLATTTTDSSGKYLFSNLNPGDYKVQVVAPSGYGVTKQDQGSDNAKDSDINSSGITALTTLSADEDDLRWDAGLYRKASVGDKVWEDWNHNNVQDVGEGGIGNIKVQLLNATGTSVLATTYTDSSGNYLFSNLNPGTYMLQFDKTNVSFSNSHWGGTYNMSDWKWAVKDAKISGVNNDAKDSDVAGDAISKTNVSKTDAFTLVSGQNDLTRDAGITPIVIDLDGNGIQTISRANSGGSFDLFGNGSAVASGWISGSDGFLAVDKNGNGTIDGISELFGGTAKGAGFAQLAAYDSNNDGLVNTSDVGFADLSIWRDVNGNHQTDAGELLSLALAGVSELVTGYTELPFLDHQGNIHLERSSATLSDGQAVSMTDVYFNVSADDAAAAGVVLPGIADLLNELASRQVPVTDAGWLFA
jgi:serine-aspartate repeat-containing protein C/D/E